MTLFNLSVKEDQEVCIILDKICQVGCSFEKDYEGNGKWDIFKIHYRYHNEEYIHHGYIGDEIEKGKLIYERLKDYIRNLNCEIKIIKPIENT